LSYEAEAALRKATYQSAMEPYVLFFARIEAYKGVDTLLAAMRQLNGQSDLRAVVAGKGDLNESIPDNVEVRNRLMGDAEAAELFRRCSLVVLPYRDATQSALIGAAYFFGKPVIVTRTGALPEYVEEGTTGWIVEPNNAAALVEYFTAAFNDPARLQRMGQAGQAWYASRLQTEQSTLWQLYERVAQV
jgi:glycosyltransferase involved in cell wall biosynthesis